ncbi:dipeptidase [Gallaecimonas kandeliae]|uniref:dipeptidase n=1 Tax=Gallaecimonas kandeliae TaxID=3029055 RepID=UPI002647387D|nr:dipeptidase [Gallaecimonas kandeliae]WKE65686.1 dipeptidase [Gallaecimonas kandeliae]
MTAKLIPSLLALGLSAGAWATTPIPTQAEKTACYAVSHYDDAQVELLADLVAYKTVHQDGIDNWQAPQFKALKAKLKDTASRFGLDFKDMGAVVVIGLGDGKERLGIVTHGDVQPADASKWTQSPFSLDSTSEPGRLIGRGTEDDKAPIATALYAMKAIKDQKLPLKRRIELIVSLTEESDWAPFEAVLKEWQPPQLNVAIDSEYPVVVAEKGWGGLWLGFQGKEAATPSTLPRLVDFHGGAFVSQVPEDAVLVVERSTPALVARLRKRMQKLDGKAHFDLSQQGDKLIIKVKGKAAHSMEPEQGVNAIGYGAQLLKGEELAPNGPQAVLDFINDQIGLDYYGRHFGKVAYSNDFMGPLTVNLSTLAVKDGKAELAINLRAPAGKSPEQLEQDIRTAIAAWASNTGEPSPTEKFSLTAAYYPQQPKHADVLLDVFRHYTGQEQAKAVSIGGGTNARLLPGGINFGPSMPGVAYSGHSEHEFVTRAQMTLNLKMYTAMMAWLGTRG